ncbi:MAG: hypothetical protein RL617_575 [Pseudomonadota bacterium]
MGNQINKWCEGGDSNPHTLRRQDLNLVRLPISPPSRDRHSLSAATNLDCIEWGLSTFRQDIESRMDSERPAPAIHGGGHYENFPVASWLVPQSIRPAVLSLYRFARCGDDLADEGDDLTAEERTHRLECLEDGLLQRHPRAANDPASRLWDIGQRLAVDLHHDTELVSQALALLSAFKQDANFRPFPDWPSVLDYCSRSANPVGRIVLGLLGVNDADSRAQSDAICTGLQLINFAQDLHEDLGRQRPTMPMDHWPATLTWTAQQINGLEALSDEERVSISSAIAARGLASLDQGAALPGRLRTMDFSGATPMALEIGLTLAGGRRVGQRILERPLVPWRYSIRLGALDWIALLGESIRLGFQSSPVTSQKP